MQKDYSVLLQRSSWRILRMPAAGERPDVIPLDGIAPEELAPQVAERLRELGTAAPEILVAVDSNSCLASQLSRDRVSPQAGRVAQLYALEASLPVSAEDVVADFLANPSGILGVAVVASEWKPLIDSVEVEGIRVRAVVPWSILVLQYLLARFEIPGSGDVLVIVRSDDQYEAFQVSQRMLSGWCLTPGSIDGITRQIRILDAAAACQSRRAILVNCEHELASAVAETGEWEVTTLDLELDVCAADTARRILAGECNPLVNFRRDALADSQPYGPLRGMMWLSGLAAVAALVCTAAGLWLRSERYAGIAAEMQARQESVFRQILPDQPIPAGVRTRLESEWIRLEGLTAESGQIDDLSSALEPLSMVLQSLPSDVRAQIGSIDIEGRQLTMDAVVPAHRDAAALAAALRNTGFELPQPRTVQMSNGTISVRLTARLKGDRMPESAP